eukprot:12333979-Alexandrium_andersonii.AAC.1
MLDDPSFRCLPLSDADAVRRPTEPPRTEPQQRRRTGSGVGSAPRAPLFLPLTGGATAPRTTPKSASGARRRHFFWGGGPGGR